MEIFYNIGYALGTIFSSSLWWFGFFIGMGLGFRLGDHWDSFTKKQEIIWLCVIIAMGLSMMTLIF